MTPDYISGYTTGFSDCKAGKPNAYPPAPPVVIPPAPPVPPPVIVVHPSYLPAGAISDYVNNATGPITLTPGATYTPDKVTVANYSIIGQNNAILRKPGAFGSTAILAQGDDVEICGLNFDSGITLDKTNDKVGVNAIRATGKRGKFHNLFGKNIDDLIFIDFTADGCAVDHVECDNTLRGDMIFIGGATGWDIGFVKAVKSWREHIIRVDNGSNSAPTAGNGVIHDFNLTNDNAKETIAIRSANAGNILIRDGTTGAWMRAGQVSPVGMTPAAVSAPNVHLQRVHFLAGTYMQWNQGTIGGSADQCTVDWTPHDVPFRGQGPNCRFTLTRNILNLAGQPFDNRVSITSGCNAGDVVEAGTVDEKGNALKQV